jgi:3-hydroxy-9,10-secoandrosta-1,3,5(10)-triene-9,17-dione monooxygenase reductase component
MATLSGSGARIDSGPPEFDERDFRRALGHFCTGVAVVTTTDGGPAGFTCQSLVSLSLDPPLVSFSAAKFSRTLRHILTAGVFGASVLSNGQEYLARRFGSARPDKFEAVAWTPSALTGVPELTDALAWVEARVAYVLPGGDHRIVVGQVVAARQGPANEDPLLFFRGQLRGARLPRG